MLLFAFVFDLFGVWAVERSGLKKYRLRNQSFIRAPSDNKYCRIALNGTLALGLYFGFAFFFQEYVTAGLTANASRVAFDVLAVLLLYDLMYYLVHRAFHFPKLMKYVHGTHHRVRNPTAADGLYLDPLDNIAGLGLFFLSVVIVGPMSTLSFILATFVYLSINNINHTGLEFPHPAFKLTNHWARKHDHHHGVNPRSNYGSIFPFWDRMFGTYE